MFLLCRGNSTSVSLLLGISFHQDAPHIFSKAGAQLHAFLAVLTVPDKGKLIWQAIQKLSDLYATEKDAVALKNLLTELRPLFAAFTKAKTAKIVRTIIETIAKVPDSTQLQVPHSHLPRFAQQAWSSHRLLLCYSFDISISLFPCSWRYAKSKWSGLSQRRGLSCGSGLRPD